MRTRGERAQSGCAGRGGASDEFEISEISCDDRAAGQFQAPAALGIGGEMQDFFDVSEIEAGGICGDFCEQRLHHPAGKRALRMRILGEKRQRRGGSLRGHEPKRREEIACGD